MVGTAAHLAMRQARSRPLMDRLHSWLEEQKPSHVPKGPMGKAIRYALGNWQALTRFLDDANIDLDNNKAEGALRRVALGRKNFLHVGPEDCGDNIAALYSLVATCEANGVNPLTYLSDVLVRIQTHPPSRLTTCFRIAGSSQPPDLAVRRCAPRTATRISASGAVPSRKIQGDHGGVDRRTLTVLR